MKIEGPNKTTGSKGVSKPGAKKSGDGAFDSLVGETEESEAQAPTQRAAPVSTLGALLSLQGADSSASEEARQRAKKRGAELLDHLEKIRMGLLMGELPVSTLRELSQTIARHREDGLDPRLTEILDEIDLRAHVELAKLEQYR